MEVVQSLTDAYPAIMGQGFSLAAPPAGAAGIDVPELGDLVYEKSIGTARFMKSIRARHHDGVVLVKILIKPYPMSLEKQRQEILRKRPPANQLFVTASAWLP